jgi:hypothetical protein
MALVTFTAKSMWMAGHVSGRYAGLRGVFALGSHLTGFSCLAQKRLPAKTLWLDFRAVAKNKKLLQPQRFKKACNSQKQIQDKIQKVY